MASELFGKKVRAVRLQLRSAAVNGRAAAGSAAFFSVTVIFWNIDSHAETPVFGFPLFFQLKK